MKTTINIDDQIIKETEQLYKAASRSKSIENALKDALHHKKLEQLKEFVGKIEFDEESINKARETGR